MTATTGARTLLRLALRRDRIVIPVWAILLTLLVASTAASYEGLYPTASERRDFVGTIDGNASLLTFYGPAFGDSIGALTAWRLGAVGAVMIGIMSILLVIRHTRAEEEDGRLELIGAGVVGRHAPLTVGIAIALVADLAVASLVTLTMLGKGVGGALAYGLGWMAVGAFFTAVAAVAAQVTENARTARGIAIGVLGAAFLLRAAGDAGGDEGPAWLSWLSPIGWFQHLRPYSDERWWVLALPVAGAVLLAGLAYSLVERRDLGAGLLPPRSGPAEAAPSLRTPLALAWRLQRGSLAAWTAGFAAYGLIIGGVIEGVGDIVGDSEGTRETITKLGGASDLTEAFVSTAFGLMAIVASIYAVQAVLRLRGEETGQRAEPLLACSVGRLRWSAGHALIALAGTALLMAVAGVTTGLTYGATAGDLDGRLADTLSAALVQIPAAWVPAGIALALFGLAPRATAGVWAAVAAFLLLGQLGPLLGLDQWAMDLSPFTHVPKLPGAAMTAAPMVWLAAVTVAAAAAGYHGFRRRDVAA
ncbi:ABC transporter permease [Thermomonospora umbrina]|uniref:ABC-2 type transport system permease protein n=1 Tax=Thermomonospora umbrina TaxID=111806 RepID=A0A3D9SVS4_9ACTN|nr:ABC transporter permease [Thermomonospora umbrina]REF00037.1 ABC-2 type transport system permease protein [Thermomonospora umbrina]